MVNEKRKHKASIGDNVEKLEPSYCTSGNINGKFQKK
jgi:hypothetical protein